jgi:hypothetical protein
VLAKRASKDARHRRWAIILRGARFICTVRDGLAIARGCVRHLQDDDRSLLLLSYFVP